MEKLYFMAKGTELNGSKVKEEVIIVKASTLMEAILNREEFDQGNEPHQRWLQAAKLGQFDYFHLN